MIARPRLDTDRLCQIFKCDPVQSVRIKCRGEQCLRRTDDDGIFCHVLAAYINRGANCKIQSFPLSHSVANRAVMHSQLLSIQIHDGTILIMTSGVALQKCHIIAIRNKANILTVMLVRIQKSFPLCDLPHLGLAQLTQRQSDVRQLFLVQHVQHITLVFALIQSLFQQITSIFFYDSRIMSRHHIVHLQFFCPLQQFFEFHIAIALNARIWGLSRLITGGKSIHDLCTEILFIIKHIKRHSQTERDTSRILRIFQRAAGLMRRNTGIFVFIELHHGAHTVKALFLHHPCCYRAVHSAAHGNQCLLTHTSSSLF